ncbi:hypothetical protein [Aeromonas veronii]|uniref:hypothetical protein n=1 Tax=Aeromonas veronii TaxID=654 RepID=UPI001F2F5A38|nr:hypothetical protein [Aeromonas veronii]MCF5769706.1 hypothetical protein [Aeromonas veronii]
MRIILITIALMASFQSHATNFSKWTTSDFGSMGISALLGADKTFSNIYYSVKNNNGEFIIYTESSSCAFLEGYHEQTMDVNGQYVTFQKKCLSDKKTMIILPATQAGYKYILEEFWQKPFVTFDGAQVSAKGFQVEFRKQVAKFNNNAL